jgi:pyruvate,water dikinase
VLENMKQDKYVRWFEDLDSEDVSIVGGKNASLGEMIKTLKGKDIRIPDGFATTAEAYWYFLEENNIKNKIESKIKDLKKGNTPLEKIGDSIRKTFASAEFPEDLAKAIQETYEKLSKKYDVEDVDVAVRSSATAEDLPEASFAGQQETFLNITGSKELLESCKKCYASLFTDRAISYREENGFDHMKVALSVGIQKMVRSDKAGAGVMFSIDTETGFPEVVIINAAWGIGENVVQGTVTPDEYIVFKPLLDKKFKPIIDKSLGDKEKKIIYAKGGSENTKIIDTPKKERQSYVLTDEEILRLARWASIIEKYYDKPMDMEWAKDGESGDIYIVQARPETVQSQKQERSLKSYKLKEKGKRLLSGLSIGAAIAAGETCIIKNAADIKQFKDDSILVTEMTDPDWVPIMKRAKGIITDYGGRTSHAAIVSREMGLPAIVGTGKGTEILQGGQKVTMSCAEGDEGYVYEDILEFEESEINLKEVPETNTDIMMNMASPAAAFRWWRLPIKGIGLARMEFIINNIIKIHPMALVRYEDIEDKKTKEKIEQLTSKYDDKTQYFVDHLARGIARIASSQYPNPVIVRMSDFKTNEYADLIGGREFEPQEENPMLGFRGASRYYSEKYEEGFELECRAIKQVREIIGLDNVIIMIPFCRTVDEAKKVLEVLEKNGLKRGENGLKIFVMAEIPSNIILAKKFAQYFDGFSIGSNDLTQTILGVDRDSAELSYLFDEKNDAVKKMISMLIELAHSVDRKVGICGQAPSDYPEFTSYLVKEGIDSISINPDSIIEVKKQVAETEHKLTHN